MVDMRSLDSLVNSLPKMPRSLEGPLMMKVRNADAIAPAAASLAQRGYIGCVPVAHLEGDELVLRLQPGRLLSDSRVAVAFWSFTEGLTIAPRLEHFVAGRMAQLDAATSPRFDEASTRQELLHFASEWGGSTAVERVLHELPGVRALPDEQVRMAALWKAANPREPVFQVLAGAWGLTGPALATWLDDAIHRFPDEPLVARLYVSYHVMGKTGVDVTDAAWTVVMSDSLFDATFNGAMPGPALNVWSYAPIVHAAHWLEARHPTQDGLEPRRALSLAAAWAFAREPDTYSGVEHLEAARELAESDPELSYTHAVTSAGCFARTVHKTPAASISLCNDLARARGWTELAQVLGWTLAELEA